MNTHCCARMDSALEHDCDLHQWPWDCPDSLIAHNVSGGDYGLRIHDGGASFVVIDFCPWCGARLEQSPAGRRRLDLPGEPAAEPLRSKLALDDPARQAEFRADLEDIDRAEWGDAS